MALQAAKNQVVESYTCSIVEPDDSTKTLVQDALSAILYRTKLKFDDPVGKTFTIRVDSLNVPKPDTKFEL